MCFTKRKVRSKESRQLFQKLCEKKETLCRQNQYSRFFMEILTYMQETLKSQMISQVRSWCSCLNAPSSYVRQRFHEAFKRCSTSQKLQYFELAILATTQPPNYQKILDINRNISISLQSFISWDSQESAKLMGYRLITDTNQFDLRRYLVRESKSSPHNVFVLQSIYNIEPERMRVLFSKSSEEDIEVFLEIARYGFLNSAQIWSKNAEHIKNKLQIPTIAKSEIIDFKNDKIQKDIWFSIIQQLNKKNSEESDQKDSEKKFKFVEDSDDEKERINKLRRIKSQNNKMMSTLKTNTSFTNDPSNKLKKRKQSQSRKSKPLPMIRNERNIIKEIFPSYNIRDIDNMAEFITITKKDKFQRKTMFYHHQSENQIKAKVKFKEISSKYFVIGLIDYLHYNLWNKLIVSAEMTMKIEKQNSIISCLKIKNEKNPFTILTHLCEYENSYIIVVKGLQNVKQYFSSLIMKIFSMKGSTFITYHIFHSDNQSFAIQFIAEVQNLGIFLMEKAGKQSLKQYLKFGRLINKDMNNKFEQDQRRSNQYSYRSEEFGNISQIQFPSSKKSEQEKEEKKEFYSVDSFSEFTQQQQ